MCCSTKRARSPASWTWASWAWPTGGGTLPSARGAPRGTSAPVTRTCSTRRTASSATTTASRSTACSTTSPRNPSVTLLAHHAIELLPREPGRDLGARRYPIDRALADAQRAELLAVAAHFEHHVGVQHHLRGRDAHLNVVPRHRLASGRPGKRTRSALVSR